MAKGPGGRNPSPKVPKGAARLGSGKTGRVNQGGNIKSAAGEPLVVPTAPGLSGDAATVQQRTAQATQGAMESGQLRKNKSAGIKLGGGGGRRRR